MSNKLIETELLGYDMIIPNNLDTLNRAFNNYLICGQDFRKLGGQLEGFLGIDKPVTEDGYGWFYGVNFNRGGGKIAALFPWTQDFDNNDGTTLDRSISIYTTKGIELQHAEHLVREIYTALSDNADKKKSERFR